MNKLSVVTGLVYLMWVNWIGVGMVLSSGVGTVRILDLAEQRGLIKSAELSIAEMTAIGYRISTE